MKGHEARRSVTQRIKVGLMMDSGMVSVELGVRLVLPQQTTVPLAARLFYSREDPYALSIAFEVGLDKSVEWLFARDLLAMGIDGREGLGDVTVWPSADSEGGTPGSVLHMELSSPHGQAHFEAPAREILDFLRRTYQIVPAGAESGHIDVEAELNDLLRQAS
jgi:Streptomyces sporulation and cell division protein, SsgA